MTTKIHSKEKLLFKAIKDNELSDVLALLKSGASTKATSIRCSNNTHLHAAAQHGRSKIVHALIVAGALIEAVNDVDATPLHISCGNGHLDATKALLSARASTTARNNRLATPLHFAAFNGHVAIAQALLDAGALINAQDEAGWTPMDVAQSADVIAILYIHGGHRRMV